MTFVFLEGIYQDKSTYSISGSTLTFATAPQSGYNIEVMVLGAISASTNALYTDTFTGDGSQTAYALGITPVDLNAIEVYLNGLYQNVSTLTLSANTVTFATAPPSGVIIEIRSVGFLNSGGTLSPATLIGGTGIDVVTNSPNNFTINNTLVDVTVSFSTPTGQSLTYTTPAASSGQVGSIFGPITFTITGGINNILTGTAVLTGLPPGITITSQSYNNNNAGNILTITLGGVYPSANATNVGIIVSGLTSTLILLVDYLVVAGGGGAGYDVGGGGGAGGLRTSFGSTSGGGGSVENTLTLDLATNYTVTVGGGGASGPSTNVKGSDGSNSIFSSISTTGGGGGGSYLNSGIGNNGGSGGGGGANNQSGGNGNTNQGFSGGSSSSSNWGSAGGGGAGGTGSNGIQATPVDGGLPLDVSITGTSVKYAGGGYGNADSGAIYVTGNNKSNVSLGVYGFGANGAGSPNASPYSGNDGVVILRYNQSFTISGLSGTTITVGSDKVTTFTSGTGNIQFS